MDTKGFFRSFKEITCSEIISRIIEINQFHDLFNKKLSEIKFGSIIESFNYTDLKNKKKNPSKKINTVYYKMFNIIKKHNIRKVLKDEFKYFIKEILLPELEIYLNDVSKSFSIKYLDLSRTTSKKIYLFSDPDNIYTWFINNQPNSDELKFIQKWLNKLEIGQYIKFVNHEGVGVSIFIEKNGAKRNISDLGYGSNQLLPIILSISLFKRINYKYKETNQNLV